MSSAMDDDDLSLSISSPQARRGSRDHQRRDADVGPMTPGPSRPTQSLPTTMKRRLGQYEIIKTLGEGSFGKVKLATHKVSGQKVALKIIARGKLITRDMAGRIEREIQYLQLLRHPHIIKLYTVITTPKEIVMVLEYAGGELFDYIVNNGRLHEDKARKFFQQIVCAIEYCHRHKIVHRDLKPENLLLDDQFNVKIADFGLSNIMTDGNFLKTSCGSPNYAAPEVISGKLYAGPEVDVWSCGVILYVLLTGRLPFDDEYIPALFKKIQQGNYTVPNYISPTASRLIRRMLQVNPMSRITVHEIRQDPWFTKDLAEYLQPPVEEFIDTGVDPNRAIDPAKLAPNKPAKVQEQLHETVVGKLGKTMGYAKADVKDALAKDEPSAIKDAYLIVRENTIMKTNPSVSGNPDLKRFLAQSPPAYGSPRTMSPLVRPATSPLVQSAESDGPRQSSGSSGPTVDMRPPSSTIAVLPSSLPSFHTAYMDGQRPSASVDEQNDVGAPHEQPGTSDERAAVAKRLNPHARGSQINLTKVEKPEGMTPLPKRDSKKVKPSKWQFGIRSRNSPSEAMLAIFKALKSMGAVWEMPKARKPHRAGEGSPGQQQREEDRRAKAREPSQSPEYSDSDPEAGTDPEYATREEREERRAKRARESGRKEENEDGGELSRHGTRTKSRGRDRHGVWNDWGYTLPEDPWIIKARFKKDDMLQPRAGTASSQSSRADLTEAMPLRKRSSTGHSQSSSSAHATPSLGGVSPTDSSTDLADRADSTTQSGESCWVYVTIQLYCIERDSYMVDFKCAGYEKIVRQLKTQVQRAIDGDTDGSTNTDNKAPKTSQVDGKDDEYVGLGRSVDEKDISSPFPFMDVASNLIVSLAQRD